MNCCGGVFDLEGKQKRVAQLNQVTSKPDFWNDSDKAQAIFKEQSSLKDVIDSWEKHRSDLEEARFFLDVAKDEKSEEALNEAAAKVAEVAKSMAQTELTQLLEHANRLREDAAPRKPFKSIKGLWADLNITLTAEEIEENQREMWKNFPRDF